MSDACPAAWLRRTGTLKGEGSALAYWSSVSLADPAHSLWCMHCDACTCYSCWFPAAIRRDGDSPLIDYKQLSKEENKADFRPQHALQGKWGRKVKRQEWGQGEEDIPIAWQWLNKWHLTCCYNDKADGPGEVGEESSGRGRRNAEVGSECPEESLADYRTAVCVSHLK